MRREVAASPWTTRRPRSDRSPNIREQFRAVRHFRYWNVGVNKWHGGGYRGNGSVNTDSLPRTAAAAHSLILLDRARHSVSLPEAPRRLYNRWMTHWTRTSNATHPPPPQFPSGHQQGGHFVFFLRKLNAPVFVREKSARGIINLIQRKAINLN